MKVNDVEFDSLNPLKKNKSNTKELGEVFKQVK